MSQEGTSGKPCLETPCVAELSPELCQVLCGVLVRVGDKWSMLVIVALEAEELRFNALRRRLGISQKVLTSTLRGLERDGYVTRMVTPGNLPQVAYALTALGREVLTPVRALALWATGRVGEIQQARARFDERPAREHGSAAP